LQYKDEINTFVLLNKDLWNLDLSDTEWLSITLVTCWLKEFRDATAEMSSTHLPMLSHTHGIFRGLQTHLRTALAELPSDTDPKVKDGIIQAHLKLSEYYERFDRSPFYLWAARKF
jgi:hypothetical protein